MSYETLGFSSRLSFTVVDIGPAVVRLHDQLRVVEDSESVDDVRADGRVDVVGLVLAALRSVPRPVGEVWNSCLAFLSGTWTIVDCSVIHSYYL